MTVPDRVVVINDASAARGGATGLALLSVRLLRQAGVPVALICGDAGDADGSPLHGAEIIALGQARLIERGRVGAMRDGLWNRGAEAMIAGWIATHDTPRTVYHLHGWAQILSPSVLAALRPVARRTVIHAHDYFLACPNGAYMHFPTGTLCQRAPLSRSCVATACDKRSYAHKLWRVTRQVGLRRALQAGRWGAIAMIHPAMEERLRRGGVPAAPLRVLRNPASGFTPERIPVEENQAIGYVGRLIEEKGVLDLARITARLGLPAVFVGDGPLANEIREIHPQARVTGWLPREEIGEVLRDVRAVAMPSRLPEPFGLAAAEAVLSGVPVILPEFALLAPEVAGHGLGRVFRAGDAADLERQVAELADLPGDALQPMSKACFAEGTRLCATEATWRDGMLGLYAELLGTA